MVETHPAVPASWSITEAGDEWAKGILPEPESRRLFATRFGIELPPTAEFVTASFTRCFYDANREHGVYRMPAEDAVMFFNKIRAAFDERIRQKQAFPLWNYVSEPIIWVEYKNSSYLLKVDEDAGTIEFEWEEND